MLVKQPQFLSALALGTHCYPAALLQKAGLRQFSGPFDWIFSSPNVVRHCIETDFREFLDRSYYDPIPIASRPEPHHYRCNHRYYRELFGIDFMFNHHDVYLDQDYAYLERCVARFRSACVQGPALGVQIRWDHLWVAEVEFAETVKCLERYIPNVTLCAFTVAPNPIEGPSPIIELVASKGAHSLYRLSRTGEWLPTTFERSEDEQILVNTLRERIFALRALEGLLAE